MKSPAEESLMDGREGFLLAFGMCRMSLRIVGLWPRTDGSKLSEHIKSIQFTLVMFVIVVFVNIAQTTKLVMVWGDLDTMTDIISTANLPIAVAVFKMLVFFHYRRDFVPLLSFVKFDWKKPKTATAKLQMQENARVARIISLICAVLGFSTVHGHLSIRIGQEFEILPGKSETRLPFVESFIPYNYKTSPTYELTWITQYIGTVLPTFAYSGIYCLFVALMLHLCGQFAILRNQLEETVRGEKSRIEFQRNLSEIVERHDSLIRFARTIEKIFNPMFLAEIFACTIQFCMQGFLLVTLSSKEDMGFPILNLLFMSVYVMHIGTHLFICCFVAEKLQDESSSMSQAAYNCKWYDLLPADAASLLIVMSRSKTPLRVTAGKFCTFSMNLYAQIFKTSGGYLSMLLAVRDRITT